MKNNENSLGVIPEILADRTFEATMKRPRELFKNGYISKASIRKLLGRSKQTIHNWENILLASCADYSLFRSDRKPLTHFHYFCLEKLSKFQNDHEPYKPESELIAFIERNQETFTLTHYISKFGGLST